MADRIFAFYIDESGCFVDNLPQNLRYLSEPSLVGGVLCVPSLLTDVRVEKLLPNKVHCCEHYDKDYIRVLEQLRADGARFVIFENKERINVLNGDTTYLNIISEGLVQLLGELPLRYPGDKVHVNVYIATRKAVDAGYGIIHENEYIDRLDEKLFVAAHRNKVAICSYSIAFRDARISRQHDVADIVCNTYLTRNAKTKFNETERERIAAVYDPRDIYSVFEDATVGYLKQLLSEGRLGEMMYQISALPKLQGVKKWYNLLLERLQAAASLERKACFSHFSLQLGLCNDERRFAEGIRLAENYKKFILLPLLESGKIRQQELDFWIFDTDFFILTMYDHLGNALKCEEYLNICQERIGAIDHSWEHIDYYFRFRIRELNCLMGRFDFDAVIEKSAGLIEIFSGAKDLFGMIETYDGQTNTLQSELLGKAYGVLLEAYINKLPQHPELFDKALEASDRAIAEFSAPGDLQRQYQYRCSLMVTAGKFGEALECLLRSHELKTDDDDAFKQFVNKACQNRIQSDAFSLWHYTNVMLALARDGSPLAEKMFKALSSSNEFSADLKDTEKDGYPWNMVLWNISRWYRMTGALAAADGYYQRALAITREKPEFVTMYAFSLCMVADYLKWNLQKEKMTKAQAASKMQKTVAAFGKLSLPQSMKEHFIGISDPDIEKTLDRYSKASLK